MIKVETLDGGGHEHMVRARRVSKLNRDLQNLSTATRSMILFLDIDRIL